MGKPLGKNGCNKTSKESRDVKHIKDAEILEENC